MRSAKQTAIGLLASAMFSAPVLAVSLTPIDYDGLTASQLNSLWGPAPPRSEDFLGFASPPNAPPVIGTLFNRVYVNEAGNVWTYEHTVTPSVDLISEFNTGFRVLGLISAGYSFGDASAAGITGFSIDLDPDGTIDWETITNGGSWDSAEAITFFFRSVMPPATLLGRYNLINSEVAQSHSYRPVPVPAAVWLLGSSLVGLLTLSRRKLRPLM